MTSYTAKNSNIDQTVGSKDSNLKPNLRKINPDLQLIAGFTAGTVSTIVLHPLDLVKVRFQLDRSPNFNSKNLTKSFVDSKPTTTISALRSIYKTQGGVQGLYRGITPAFIGSSLSWGLYFWLYAHTKTIIYQRFHNEPNSSPKLNAFEHLLASSIAGGLTTIVANPCFVVKTRFCGSLKSDSTSYKNTFDAFSSIIRNEGFFGLYRGIVPALFGVSHGAVQFMAYEELKRSNYFKEGGTINYLAMASISKIFATLVTYPYQVIKSRIQISKDLTIRTEVRNMWIKEGILGFYKGIGPNIIRVLPGSCITFGVYEFMTKHLEESFDK